MELEWSVSEDSKESEERPHYFTILECGDVVYPDTLVIKYKAMMQTKKDCVIPDSLAYFDIATNNNLVYKHYTDFPRSGIYWKKSFWLAKSSEKIVGIPYIGNCVTIGSAPTIKAFPQMSSIKFFPAFPPEIKQLIREILTMSKTQQSKDVSESENDAS